ncbi:MAG: peptide chain release factor N(5)-glutamine methyltransferase [Xanthomonadales bacterium]|nr:peptide chain release factor N(5)-glutamine methyltransferase [Xanthomonadales bacterium]
MSMTLAEQLNAAQQRLAAQGDATASPRLEADLLMCQALGVPRSHLFAYPEQMLDQAELKRFGALLERRLQGEPMAYLAGVRSFWSLELEVNPEVLIPRPETELLVEWGLELLAGSARAADLGTGSGAIALALASERPGADIHATDCSAGALETARRNASALGLDKVQFHQGSWTTPLQGSFELLVSNPPYVAADDPHLQQGDCRFEPRAALSPGADALVAYRDIISEAPAVLQPAGWLLFEHGHEQGSAVRELLHGAGFEKVSTRPDLAGLERISGGRWRS